MEKVNTLVGGSRKWLNCLRKFGNTNKVDGVHIW